MFAMSVTVFKREVLFHRIIGVWPRNGWIFGGFDRARSYVSLVCFVALCAFQLTDLAYASGTGGSIFESITEVTIALIATLKGLLPILKRDSILELVKMTKQISESPESSLDEVMVRVRWQKYQDELINFCIKSYLTLDAVYVCTPFFTDKKFPLNGFLPVVADVFPWYQFVYVIESLGIVLNTCAILSNDTFCIAFMCQLCAELEVVKYSIKKLNKKDKNCLPQVIKRHVIALDYGAKVCNCFQAAFLIQHVVISVFLCFAGITVLKTNDSMVLARVSAIAIILVLTLLTICLVGELVTDSSLAIARAIESHGFAAYLGDLDGLRASNLALRRAQWPLRMTVGWDSSINLRFFTETTNKLVSAFMVLKAMVE